MALVGVFGWHLSKKSGGVFSLVHQLMLEADHSTHSFLYFVSEKNPQDKFPSNVKVIQGGRWTRVAFQFLQNIPGIEQLWQRPAFGKLLGRLLGLRAGLGSGAPQLWLWPNSFSPFPLLGPMAVICHDLIHHAHPEYFSRFTLRKRRAAEKTLGQVGLILCPSANTARDLEILYPAYKNKIRQFSETSTVNRAAKPDFGATKFAEPFFLFVAMDWTHKNHDLLMRAAVELKGRSSKPFKIVFTGYRQTRFIQQEIDRQGLQSLVCDLGRSSAEELHSLYSSALAFVFPSRYEGYGIPLVEAMKYALPVVSSNQSCMPEVCGDAAVLLNPEDAPAWAGAMKKILEQPEWVNKLREASRSRGATFSWDRTWREIDAALQISTLD